MVTVYVDILLILNAVVDFFIITVTVKFTKSQSNLLRETLSALSAAVFSLYIFLPETNILIEILMRIVPSVTAVLVACGYKNFKAFIRRTAVFYAVSYFYAGVMLGLWLLLKPKNFVVNNGVVYFNFSPLVLLLSAAFCYMLITLVSKLSKRHAPHAKRVRITVETANSAVNGTALVDTGNSVSDIFSGLPVIIVSKKFAEKIYGENVCCATAAFDSPHGGPVPARLIPYSTINGEGLLPAYKSRQVILGLKGSERRLNNALIAVTNTDLGEDYDAVINPEIL